MNHLEIEKIEGSENNEVSFCRERGGIVVSMKLNNKEILYLDETTLENNLGPVRGGIPILFPNAGELIDNNEYPLLKRHGFARDLIWTSEKQNNGFREVLLSDDNTLKIFPYNFEFSIDGFFEDNGSFTFKQEIKNLSEEKHMPISIGLHPYFKVNNTEKGYIKFNFDGGQEVEDQIDIWSNGGTVYFDNPKLKDPDALIEVEIPSLGTIVISASLEYQTIWVWSMPGKDFICIEPMMRGLNGFIDDPFIVKNKGSFNASVNFKLQ